MLFERQKPLYLARFAREHRVRREGGAYYKRHRLKLAPGSEGVKKIEKKTMLYSSRKADGSVIEIKEDKSMVGIRKC